VKLAGRNFDAGTPGLFHNQTGWLAQVRPARKSLLQRLGYLNWP